MDKAWWWLLPIGAAVGVEAVVLVRAKPAVTSPAPTGPTRPVRIGANAPGPAGSTEAGPCDPMTMHCLLTYPVGQLPVPDALGWIPAQHAARQVADSGHSIPELVHHPAGYYGGGLVAAQQSAQYLIDIGVDPAPQFVYEDLAAASRRSGVPLPLLLAVAYGESRYLEYGTKPNQAFVSPYDDVGLMQVGQSAVNQVNATYHLALTWTAVTDNPAANALAGAFLLRYLATQRGLNFRSADYAAWQPIVAEGYGEGTAALLTIQNAADTAWNRQQRPADARALQAQRTTRVVAAPAHTKPAAVHCQDVHMPVSGGRVHVVRVCSDGVWTVQ